MKKTVITLICGMLFGAPALTAQSKSGDHIEIGIFADYFNLSRTTPNTNYVGIGGRAGFNVHPNVQLEAEMAYDFERNFTTVFSDGVNTRFVRTSTRPLHGLFGPKFMAGSGAFRAFGTFKVGFVSFSTTHENVPEGFEGALGAVTSGDTRATIYPGVGIEAFLGPIGLRLDGGDDIYFDHGAQNNLKITLGPVLRF